MKRCIFIVIPVLILASACTKLDYIGEEYPPTTHVDLFFSEDAVERDHKVMGHLIATADDFVSAEKMQKKMIKKAMEKGADGLVILGLEIYQAGESTTYKEASETGVTKKGKPKTTTTATTKTTTDEKKQIKAILIKYM